MKWLILGRDEAPPTNIDWSEKDRRGLATFLVAKDQVQFWERRKPSQWPEIQSEKLRLWLFAYVDYRDIFGKRFRGGYSRVYKPLRESRSLYQDVPEWELRSNFVFPSDGEHNYDRARKNGEGKDWKNADLSPRH